MGKSKLQPVVAAKLVNVSARFRPLALGLLVT
jgi:hypothetical protein